ncbi:MAG TPA: macro domain-containing protein, partial [Lachnospiraceae bacterium]|nr:macro domain-containing protein [Lachnospiraceae bacterium]
MSFRIIRNDITKMNVEAIVNTANGQIDVGAGCDLSVYRAAGFDQLLEYRKQHIGQIEEGQSFLTPGFDLAAKYIIHTVSPFYWDGKHGEEEKLRNCYRNSLRIAKENDITEIAF